MAVRLSFSHVVIAFRPLTASTTAYNLRSLFHVDHDA